MADGMPVQRCGSMRWQVGMRWLGMILSCACTSTCACRYTCLHTLTHNSSVWHTQTHTPLQCGIVVSQSHFLPIPTIVFGVRKPLTCASFKPKASPSGFVIAAAVACIFGYLCVFICSFGEACLGIWSGPVAAFCTHFIKTVGRTYVRQSVCSVWAALMHQPLEFGILSHKQQYRAVTSMRPPALNRPSWRWQQ